MKANLEYDNIIKDKEDLLSQLESLKEDAIAHLQCTVSGFEEVFQRDLHALKIVIHYLKELK